MFGVIITWYSAAIHTHSPENSKPSLHTDEDNYGA